MVAKILHLFQAFRKTPGFGLEQPGVWVVGRVQKNDAFGFRVESKWEAQHRGMLNEFAKAGHMELEFELLRNGKVCSFPSACMQFVEGSSWTILAILILIPFTPPSMKVQKPLEVHATACGQLQLAVEECNDIHS